MKILVTGSAGHLGEALVRLLRAEHEVVGVDLLASPTTAARGSIVDRGFVHSLMSGVDAVLHTATLHKPHVATHPRSEFIDTNVTGTLNLLEEAVAAGTGAFIFTSTTSVFGRALVPPMDQPAAWIDEEVAPIPKNIYGVTKSMAEGLCELFAYKFKLPTLVLRTSRFFPEADDSAQARRSFEDANLKANEFLYRRVDVEDAARAHIDAIERAQAIGFDRYIISAPTPFSRADAAALRTDPAQVVAKLEPAYEADYARRNWVLPASIDRVYDSGKAQRDLDWRPRYDFKKIVAQLAADGPIGSDLARTVGAKGYHAEPFDEGPYPVEK